MPSRTEKVNIYYSNDQMSGKAFDFPLWWDRRAFFENFSERKVDTNHPLYVDYAYLLASGEAIAWNNACLNKMNKRSQKIHASVKVKMEQFSEALKGSKWIIVESYEWESGL